MNRGFRGFRRPEIVTPEAVKLFVERSGLDRDQLYIYWTGGEYRRRPGSARSQALYALRVQEKPVKVADWISEAAKCKDQETNLGFDPATVRSGLFLHQGAKPAVYWVLEKRSDGAFVAARNIPNPDPRAGFATVKAGDVIIAAEDASEAKVMAIGSSVTETAETKALPAPTTRARKGKGRR